MRAYDGAYVLMPEDAPLVPERRTKAPRVEGPETAVVVGEGEIDCDKYGRILVKFHWDLNAADTMRCRVSQNWTSKGRGGMVIPRIGMEVIVEHLRGDPDKPIVTGCVYNGYNMAPYELPRHKTRSTFKTDKHQGQGFNEIRFEDEKRLEEIMVHAQRDMNSVIRRDTFRSTGRHDGLEVKQDRMVSVGGNSINETKGTIEIASGQGTVISSGAVGMSSRAFSRITQLEDPEFINAKASLKAMESAMPTGGITVRAQTMLNEQVGMSRTTMIGAASLEFVSKEKTVQVGKLMQLKSGSAMVMTTADNLAVQAGSRIDTVCGKSSIRMTADGKIEIKGVSIVMDADQIDMNRGTGMSIGIEKVGSAPVVPRPPKSANDVDEADPSVYIPESLSEAARTELRNAAQHWAGTLGGVLARNSGTAGIGPDSGQAADHMNHFLNGEGEDLNLSRPDMREIRTTVGSVGDFENAQLQNFLEQVRADFANGGSPHRQYLSKNERASSPNFGENWFALSEERGKKWFFALGSFWIAYGAHAFLAVQNEVIRIHYRMYLYDRYNWDVGKQTNIPGGALSWLIDDDLMSKVTDLNGPMGWPYMTIEEDGDGNITTYTVNDSLLGSLTATGDADHYDIVGAGYLRSVQFPVESPPAGTVPLE